MKFSDFFIRIIFKIAKLANKVSSWCIFFIMAITVTDIFGRYFFNVPIAGVFEVTEVTLSIMVFLSLAYTHICRGHVRIDFFISKLSKKNQKYVEGVVYFLSFILIGLLTWQLWVYALRLFKSGNVSGVLEIPFWPILLIMVFGSLVYAITLAIDFIQIFWEEIKNES